METRKSIDVEIVDVNVPKGTGEVRRERPVPAKLGKWRERVGRGMRNQTHAAMHVLNETAGREPPHAGNPKAWVKILGRGSQRGNEVRNLGRGNRKGKGAVRQPTRRKGK